MSLFDVDALPIDTPIEKQIACVDTELRRRERMYPRQVLARQMTETRAREQIGMMQAVRASLVKLSQLRLTTGSQKSE